MLSELAVRHLVFHRAHYRKHIFTCWLILLAKASLGASLGFSGRKLDSSSCIGGTVVIRLRIQMVLGQVELLGYQGIAA